MSAQLALWRDGYWRRVDRADSRARALVDGESLGLPPHYSRQTPGVRQGGHSGEGGMNWSPLRHPVVPEDFAAVTAGNLTLAIHHHECGFVVVFHACHPKPHVNGGLPVYVPTWLCMCEREWTDARVQSMTREELEAAFWRYEPTPNGGFLVWREAEGKRFTVATPFLLPGDVRFSEEGR